MKRRIPSVLVCSILSAMGGIDYAAEGNGLRAGKAYETEVLTSREPLIANSK
ncbi:hypothetical protein N9230_05815 [Akkermansiaceae bacterium]|nr:hypothetical protein [Akkermansiaceae bacterium]